MLLRDCNSCGLPEERLFTDTYSGRSVCITCLEQIISRINMSPESDGDNLDELLKEKDGETS